MWEICSRLVSKKVSCGSLGYHYKRADPGDGVSDRVTQGMNVGLG